MSEKITVFCDECGAQTAKGIRIFLRLDLPGDPWYGRQIDYCERCEKMPLSRLVVAAIQRARTGRK